MGYDLQNIDGIKDAVEKERVKSGVRIVTHTEDLATMPPLKEWNAENIGNRTFEYLEKCKEDGVRPNLSGYSLSLGTTPDGLNEMICDKRLTDETRAAILKGVSMVESIMITMLTEQRINPVTGIFLLKNHFGYKDQSEITFKGKVVTTTDKKTLQAKYKAVVDDD